MSYVPQNNKPSNHVRSPRPNGQPMDATLYTEKLIKQVYQFGLPWMRVGVLVRDKQDRFLLVHEAKVERFLPVGSSEWITGDGGWNIPAGRVNVGEDLRDAAIREAREESGYDVRISGICEIAQRTPPNNPYTIVTFVAEVVEYFDDFDREEVSEVGWFTFEEIQNLQDAGKLRSPDLVIGAIEKSRRFMPANLSLIRT